MQISANGLAFIHDWEKCRLTAYLDAGLVWTIGWGSTRIDGQPVRPKQVVTQAQADEQCLRDFDHILKVLPAFIDPAITLTQSQTDALISFSYNCGLGAFMKSTLRRRINAGLSVEPSHFLRWNKVRDREGVLRASKGLTRRRQAEYYLYGGSK